MINLYDYQKIAVGQLKTGSILCGGVGSGKSLTALTYYFTKECGGNIYPDITNMKNPKDLFVITTAAKRNTLDWERESSKFLISKERSASINNVLLTVDSWNNIKKYTEIKNAFFIFDEQRLVGSGSWVKSFLKIVKNNNWILLSATPGDTWSDYIPVFIANGFYKNRTEFIRNHIVYNSFTKFPKIDHYIEQGKLQKFKNQILVKMLYEKKTISHNKIIYADYDKEKVSLVLNRWNPFEDKPIKDISEYCYVMRKVVNSNISRLKIIEELLNKHQKIIVFYNFNYELYMLRTLKETLNIELSEYNGHKHEPLPKSNKWIYLVQYTSGAEGWNCIETNSIVFYSQNYSYKMMVQAAGRIDRLNTPFLNLYYYTILSKSEIDLAIAKALKSKKDFNEKTFHSS